MTDDKPYRGGASGPPPPFQPSRAELVAELDLVARLMRRQRWWSDAFYSSGGLNDIEDVRRIDDGLQARCMELMRQLFPGTKHVHEPPPSGERPYGGNVDGWIAKLAWQILGFPERPDMRSQLEDAFRLARELAAAVTARVVPPSADAKAIAAERLMDEAEGWARDSAKTAEESVDRREQFAELEAQLARDLLDAVHAPGNIYDSSAMATRARVIESRARVLAEYILGVRNA